MQQKGDKKGQKFPTADDLARIEENKKSTSSVYYKMCDSLDEEKALLITTKQGACSEINEQGGGAPESDAISLGLQLQVYRYIDAVEKILTYVDANITGWKQIENSGCGLMTKS